MSTLTLFPTSDSYNSGGNTETLSTTNLYQSVDENPADDDTSYILPASAGANVLFSSNQGTIPAGATGISLTIYGRYKGSLGRAVKAKNQVKSGSSTSFGTEISSWSGWTDRSDTFSNDPATSTGWTVSGANSATIGFVLTSFYDADQDLYFKPRCTQIYWIWTYTPPAASTNVQLIIGPF